MKRNRRTFLKTCCSIGAAGVASQLGRFSLLSAQSPTANDYRALVCVFLFGGNDSNNMVVPLDSRFNGYKTMRGPVALESAVLLPAGTSGYGLHPALRNVQQYFNSQSAAAVLNVGTLSFPVQKSSLTSAQLPKNLFSHSDQVQLWQTADGTSSGISGWGGRLNDTTRNLNSGTVPAAITLSGTAAFINGLETSGISFSNAASFGLRRFGDSTAMNARQASLQKVITFDSGVQLVSAADGVLGDAMSAAQEISAAVAAAPALPVAFPTSGLAQQLAQVAQIIAVRGSLGMNRQIFFVGLGGFDNHENLLTSHQTMMATLDAALGPFLATMQERGTFDAVTVFTESEFNRTGNPNANLGTDHAWGGHHLVMGGAVRGGTTYGSLPTLLLRGPDDYDGRGNWIPTTALDQYAATLANWFGVPETELARSFPNLSRFSPSLLGFV